MGESTMRALMAATVLLSCAAPALAEPKLRAGQTYELLSSYRTFAGGDDSSSSTSSGRTLTVERVLAIRDDGVELEYDLPDSAAGQRAATWQLPARVFKPNDGPLRLLNRPELEVRLDAWLAAARLTRADCGRWYFTWNAFRVECEPESILNTIDDLTFRPDVVSAGTPYRDPAARTSAPLRRSQSLPVGQTFTAELELDPERVRQERIEADLVVAEITGEPLARAAAVQKRSAEVIGGSVQVTLDADASGAVRKRTRTITVKSTLDGVTRTETTVRTLERRRVGTD